MEIVPGQIGEFIVAPREIALIGKVMDGETARGRRRPGSERALEEDQQWDEGGLPVMNVDYLRLPRQVTGQMRHAFGEEDEPVRVVRVIPAALAVESGAVIEFRTIDKVDREPFAGFVDPDLSAETVPALGQFE